MAHYFLGIHLPGELQEFYQAWQRELKPIFPYKRWTANEDLHITLAFLGEANEEQIDALTREMESIRSSCFSLQLGGLGIFGQKNRPRVLFIDVQLNEELIDLHQQVSAIVEKVGFSTDKRPYRPHVTLGKKWDTSSTLPPGKIQEMQNRFSEKREFRVSAVSLFKIHPQQEPSYEAVSVFPLKK